MSVEIVGTSIDVDLFCNDCDHEWQETFYEDHVNNVTDKDFECPRCKLYDDDDDDDDDDVSLTPRQLEPKAESCT